MPDHSGRVTREASNVWYWLQGFEKVIDVAGNVKQSLPCPFGEKANTIPKEDSFLVFSRCRQEQPIASRIFTDRNEVRRNIVFGIDVGGLQTQTVVLLIGGPKQGT